MEFSLSKHGSLKFMRTGFDEGDPESDLGVVRGERFVWRDGSEEVVHPLPVLPFWRVPELGRLES